VFFFTSCVIAAGGADDDAVLDRKRCRGDAQLRLADAHIGFPHHLAGFLVGADDAGRVVGGRDDEIAPQGGAAVVGLLLGLGVHPPDDPPGVAGPAVDLVQRAPRIGYVDEAVFNERRRLDVFVAGRAGKRHRVGELEILDVALVGARQRREALAIVRAMVHQPVLRLAIRIEQPLRRHVGREGR
jgi:hypothetical protein